MVSKFTNQPTNKEVVTKINEVIDNMPTVNNATLTIQRNGSTVKTFTANASTDVTCNIGVPTKTSQITNDSGFVTTDTKNTTGGNDTSSKIYLVGMTSQTSGSGGNNVTYTHDTAFVDTSGQLNSANPAANTNNTIVATTKWVTDKGYTTNIGTVTSVNSVLPNNAGNVSLTIPTKTSDLNNDSGFQANVIETIKVNNVAQTVTSKTVNITVPSAVTESTVSGWGFTKNTGTVTSVNNVSPVNGNVSLTIPTVNNATLTIQKNGTTVKTFTANASSNVTCNITVPTKVSDLTNDSGFTSNIGTVTSVNSTSPDANGNVAITIPTYNFNGEPFYSTNGNATTITRDCNGLTANGHYYYTSNGPSGLGEQSTDGALYVQGYNDLWVTQIAQDYRTGNLFTRSRNSGTWTSWRAIGTSSGANTDLSNLTATGKAVIDGQWVASYLSVPINNLNVGSYQQDLSSYLPNDNYSYEIYVEIGAYYNGSNCGFAVGTVASPSTNRDTAQYVMFQWLTSYHRGGYSTAIIPIDTNRKLYYQFTDSKPQNAHINIHGYRRIGTNS